MPFIACLTNTQQKQQLQRTATKTKDTTHTSQPTQKQADHNQLARMMSRCSRPLSNYQPTHPPRTPNHTHTQPHRRRKPWPAPKEATKECDPSKPNSVSDTHPATRPRTFHAPSHPHPTTEQRQPANSTKHDPPPDEPIIDDSTHEHHHAPTHTRGRSAARAP